MRWPGWLRGNDIVFLPPSLMDDEWERDPERERRMQQLRDGELIEFNGEVHWAPLRPRATTDVPSEPGFYARRPVGTAYWSVVEVLPDKDGSLWWAQGSLDPVRPVEPDERYEWSERPYQLPR